MNTLKPKGDSIAHEFYGLMKKAGVSLFDQPIDEINEEDLDRAYEQATRSGSLDEAVKIMGEQAIESGRAYRSGETGHEDSDDELASLDLHSMLRGDSESDFAVDSAVLGSIDEAYDAISRAEDGMKHTASEQRVLDGLQKIAAGLRSKGEGFASDVVLATANSIKGDLDKRAKQRSVMVEELQKVARNFYAEGEQLAGDMVSVTIDKLANNRDRLRGRMDEMMGELDAQTAGSATTHDRLRGRMDEMMGELDAQVAKQKKAPSATTEKPSSGSTKAKPDSPKAKKENSGRSKYPVSAEDIPRVYTAMQKAIKEANDPFKEMDISLEHGFVRSSMRNGQTVMVFNLKGGGQGEYTLNRR